MKIILIVIKFTIIIMLFSISDDCVVNISVFFEFGQVVLSRFFNGC